MQMGADVVSAVHVVEQGMGIRSADDEVVAVPDDIDNDRALAELQKLMP